MLPLSRLSRRQLTVISTVLVLCMVVGAYLYHTWHKPLGPTLNLADSREQGESAPGASSRGSLSPADPRNTSGDSSLEPICGGPPSMMIMIAGVGATDHSAGPADAIRLARLDFQRGEVSLLALSPDMWVDIPDIADHGIKQARLNQAYLFGTEKVGFYGGRGQGAELLARTLHKNFGLRPDHYIALDFLIFREIINEIGGIEVDFPRDMNLTLSGEPGLTVKAGPQHLDGRQAEIVVRSRIKEDDYSRLDNQIMVFKALASKILSSTSLQELPNLVNLVLERVRTDFSPSQIKKLICLARNIDPAKDITYLNLPRELLTRKRLEDKFLERKVYAYTWETNNTRRLIANFQAGGVGD